jgi:YVTN family beta-propeller protein
MAKVGRWPIDERQEICMMPVTNNKTNDISVTDVAMLKVVATVDVGMHPADMAFGRVSGED